MLLYGPSLRVGVSPGFHLAFHLSRPRNLWCCGTEFAAQKLWTHVIVASTNAKSLSVGPTISIMLAKWARVLQGDASSCVAGWRDPAGSGGVVDRRRASRFQLRLPVLTQWTNVEGNVRHGGGFTRDISLLGLFLVSSEAPPQATTINVTVMLPNPRAGSQELRLQSVGSVVRVEQERSISGYAISCSFSGIEELVKQHR